MDQTDELSALGPLHTLVVQKRAFDKLTGRTAPRPMNPFFYVSISRFIENDYVVFRASYPLPDGKILTRSFALAPGGRGESLAEESLRQELWQELERMRLEQEAR